MTSEADPDTPTPRADRDASATSFADLDLRPELLRQLTGLGYEEPTPIQREAIPPVLQGLDLLGQAATGTGKTAAFALPILNRLRTDGSGPTPLALVLVPTRELAVQVSEAIHRYGRDLGARVLPIYGGQPIVRQLRALKQGVDVVVATPGRAVDHINRRTLDLDRLEIVVLDEADEMLDMGFAEELETILDAAPTDRQTVLFSATMPPRIDGMARRHLKDPIQIRIDRETTPAGEAPRVRQIAYVVARAHKAAALGRVLDVEAPAAAIVFCRTRAEVDQLTETLNGRGHRAEALHGGMDQEQRDRVMNRLRGGTADLLVATDVAARGLDVEQLTHVVNYDVPSAPDSYTHRIGRVGRAGREGVAITLAEPREHRMLKTIERVTKQKINIEKVPTVVDLRHRQLDQTRAALEEHIQDGDLERFRVVVEALADEHDLVEVALAAVKLAHEARGVAEDDIEIPEVASKPERNDRGYQGRNDRGSGGYQGRNDRGRPSSGSADGRPNRDRPGPSRGGSRSRSGDGGDTVRIFIGAGKEARIRPNDLVGAIANETRLSGKDIGHIEIADRFSLVELPSDAADEVVAALKATTIKGRKPTVRRERYDPRRR